MVSLLHFLPSLANWWISEQLEFSHVCTERGQEHSHLAAFPPRLPGSLTPALHHNWKRNLAPRLARWRKKSGLGNTEKKCRPVGTNIANIACHHLLGQRRGAIISSKVAFARKLHLTCNHCDCRQREGREMRRCFANILSFSQL